MNLIQKLNYLWNLAFQTPETYARKRGVKIGNDCWIATRNFGSEPYLITIGNHMQITDNVSFFTHGGGWVFRKGMPIFVICSVM